MTKDTLERAIKKGAGLFEENVNYETVVFEGFAPHQVPVIVECLTENKNRTATNVRVLFRAAGQFAGAGASSGDFAHVGIIEATSPEDEGRRGGSDRGRRAGLRGRRRRAATASTRIHSDLDTANRALAAAGWNVLSVVIGWRPKNPVSVDAAARAEVEAFLEAIDEDDDVRGTHVGLAD